MNKLFIIAGVIVCASSCSASYYAAQGTIGMQNLSGNATVDQAALTATTDDGMRVTYDVAANKALIANTTDKTLYLDKATSYYISHDGVSSSLFSNSVTTVTSSSTTGATVNMGAVAGALGVKGPAAALASGFNVGNANTTGYTTQMFEQQYVVIPPYASQVLDLPEQRYQYSLYLDKGGSTSEHFTQYNNPLHSQYLLSYNFEGEDKKKVERDSFYLSDVEAKSEKGFSYKSFQNNKISKFFSDDTGPILANVGLAFVGLGGLFLGLYGVTDAEGLLILGATYGGLGLVFAEIGGILCLTNGSGFTFAFKL